MWTTLLRGDFFWSQGYPVTGGLTVNETFMESNIKGLPHPWTDKYAAAEDAIFHVFQG